jgi:hypothetical protein
MGVLLNCKLCLNKQSTGLTISEISELALMEWFLRMVMENSEKGMKRKLFFWVIGFIMSMTASVPVAKAGLISVAGGTIAPLATLGPYTMTPFSDDLRPTNLVCSHVTSPSGENVFFSMPMVHNEIMDGWLSWSNSYSGDVYLTGEDTNMAVLIMPPETCAFYFYAQPRYKNEYTITATAYDGVSYKCTISQDVQGQAGACYYGFYGTEDNVIHSITIYSNTDFAIGEFGISMLPAPEALLLSNMGLSIVLGLRRLSLL